MDPTALPPNAYLLIPAVLNLILLGIVLIGIPLLVVQLLRLVFASEQKPK